MPLSRRDFIRHTSALATVATFGSKLHGQTGTNRANLKIFDVRDYGAVGNGVTADTAAFQRAIDEAAASSSRAQVLVRGGKRYLVGAFQLKGGIDFHLADDAELYVSAKREDYPGGAAVITADGAMGLRLSGTGSINGRSPEFMTHFDQEQEWWRPGPFRPRLVVLTACKDLEIRDFRLHQAPSWTLHLMGCERVLVDRVTIRNQLDVPNCDGIDPDHCRDVEISNCDIACGDDAVVIKTTRQGERFGPSSKIVVKDCTIETQDSAVKIGTETTQDITDIRFERIKAKTCCRGACIQLRDTGNVSNIVFRDLEFTSRYFSDPWWGRGEAISLTAIPRAPETKIGSISNVRIENVTARAENSVRISGSPQSRLRDIRLERVALTLDRWTKYRGGVWDNRPTSAMPDLEPHATPAFAVRHADNVVLKDCSVAWGKNLPDDFTHALEAENVTGLEHPGFKGEAAHPGRDPVIVR